MVHPTSKPSSSPPPALRSQLPYWMQRQNSLDEGTDAVSPSRALNVPRTDRIVGGRSFVQQQRRSLLDIVDEALHILDGCDHSDRRQQQPKEKDEDQEASDDKARKGSKQ